MIGKLLIANRGEIAIRIANTCDRLNIAVAGVHSSADRDALHVRRLRESYAIGAAPPSESYLNIEAIVSAALRSGADAVHPGIGFLAESPEFAAAVEAAGLTFVGPRPDLLANFGDKAKSKEAAVAANVPIIEGTDAFTDVGVLTELGRKMQLPLMLKAVAGGGGRGSRIVREYHELESSIQSAMREAQASFGRSDLMIESFVESARHVEVQIVGDGKGKVLHLFERECSLQRRFQKIIEEAPAQHLSPDGRDRLIGDAVRLASQVHYRSAGTFEFLVAGDRHYFLECNPRLQVEHTITEEITGIDIVELQLRTAAEGSLPLEQSDIIVQGHAIQARLYAEDPARDFLPSTGKILRFDPPPGNLRIETGVETGSEITPHYDSLLAKVIAHAPDRTTALAQLKTALEQTTIMGVETNLGLLTTLCADPNVIADRFDNRYIDRELGNMRCKLSPDLELVGIAAACELRRWRDSHAAASLWASPKLSAWRLPAGEAQEPQPWASALTMTAGVESFTVQRMQGADEESIVVIIDDVPLAVTLVPTNDQRYLATINGLTRLIDVAFEGDMLHLHAPLGAISFELRDPLATETAGAKSDGNVMSNMMGVIIKVNVNQGDHVEAGDTLMLQESMKMELRIEAPMAGIVTMIACAEGDMIERNVLVARIEADTNEEKAV